MAHLAAWAAPAALMVSFTVLYWPVLRKLTSDWASDANYSHGFLVVPIALYFAWERRARFRAAVPRPSALGLIVVIGSVATMIAGTLGAELFLTRISIVGVAAGTVWFLFGREHLRILAFPLAFLVLMIPLPSIIFNQVAFPLQLLASTFGESALHALSIPAVRDGNIIVLDRVTLEVAEACSGIRSLVSLLTLSIVYSYFTDSRPWVRITAAVMTLPIAIITNGVRVAGTGIAAHYYGAAAATGFLHEASGWLMFVAAFTLLSLGLRMLTFIAPGQWPNDPPVARPV
ncbi:MAG: exosortase A [Vicinamibacterales bacterium]